MIVEKYVKLLDNIAEKFNDKDKIKSFLNTYKWKILLFIFLMRGLGVMYEVYAIGTCVNCGNLTEDQMRDIVKNSETVSEFTNQLKFVPHTDLITYFKDLWLPLCANWAAIFLSLSILYVVWKVLSTVLLKAYLSVVKNTTPKQKNKKI
jgi:hypothetical protein